MRALFLVPPPAYNARGQSIDRVYGCNYGFDYKPPIHLLAVATYARDVLGWEVRFADCPAEGIDQVGFETGLAQQDWDVVCAWSTWLSAIEDVAAARILARSSDKTRFLFMGAGATWRPEEFDIDGRSAVLLGEPEHTLADVAKAWEAGHTAADLPGLAWFDPQGVCHRGPFRPLLDVSSLPMPDRGLLRGHYRANRLDKGPVTVMAVSRGCGFRCTFCMTHAMDQAIDLEFKRRLKEERGAYDKRAPLRKRTPEQVVAELRDIAARGYKSVEIADNIFTWGRARTLEICAGIEDLGLEWVCLARASMLHDPEVVAAMGNAGCKLVYMGSESFDDGLLDDMMKEQKVRDVERAVRTCRENGVEPEVSVLIGASPKETWGSLWRSWRASRRLGTRFVHFSVALPAPCTALYEDALSNGWFVDGDFRPIDNQREVIVDLPNLSRRELQAALKLAYAAQYLSPTGIWKHARTVRSTEDLVHKAKAAGALFQFLGEAPEPRRVVVPAGRVTPMPTSTR